jgi:hypothetical protein
MFCLSECSVNSFPTQKSKKFGIPFRNDHSHCGKRKMKNEYKTKKTVFQEDTAENTVGQETIL